MDNKPHPNDGAGMKERIEHERNKLATRDPNQMMEIPERDVEAGGGVVDPVADTGTSPESDHNLGGVYKYPQGAGHAATLPVGENPGRAGVVSAEPDVRASDVPGADVRDSEGRLPEGDRGPR